MDQLWWVVFLGCYKIVLGWNMSDRVSVQGRLPSRRFVVPEEGGELPGGYARDAVERIFFDGSN